MRFLLFLFLLFLNLEAKRIEDVVECFISEDGENYKKALYVDYIDKQLQSYTIKFTLNKDKPYSKYYLSIVSNIHALKKTNVEYEINNSRLITIDLSQLKSDTFYFYYEHPTKVRPDFRYKAINAFEYEYILEHEGILYGISYGIIFCAFLYYLVIYISTRIPFLLYYSAMQFFVLLTLICFTYLSYQSYVTDLSQATVDIFETLSFMFTLLFAQSVLNIKKHAQWIFNAILFICFFHILDVFWIFIYKYSLYYEYIPFSVTFLIAMMLGLYVLFKGNKIALIYIIGWAFVFLAICLNELDVIELSGIYTIHIVTALESIVFSFALGYMLKSIVEDKNEKEKLLIHQNKLASMGEMINNIAHQWRQPLTHLSFINMDLELASSEKKLSSAYLLEKLHEGNRQIEFMSQTIDNFRDFYKPNKEKEHFYLSESITQALNIMKPLLEKHNIKVNFNLIFDKEIYAYKNELAQVILNLITNAKDALLQKEVQNPYIDIKLDEYTIVIEDNAQGIDEALIEDIFNPYFTTKEKGSGIGLYMSKMIVESHFKGRISVTNTSKGACFKITF